MHNGKCRGKGYARTIVGRYYNTPSLKCIRNWHVSKHPFGIAPIQKRAENHQFQTKTR